MSRHDIYNLILCIIVFVLLTVVLTILVGYVVKLLLRSIRAGTEDEKIKIEYEKAKKKKQSKALLLADKAFSGVVFLLFFALFLCSMFVNIRGTERIGNLSRLQVVSSSSMSKKYERNDYLFKNDLNDQFDTFDIILTHKLPAEEELKLYDIVVYEVDELLVVHRIVGIEEPNDKHPNERHFLLQGDNVGNPDKFPVLYSQMKGIYRGQRVPFVGSLVMFMRSPAGILCVLLIVFAMVATPIVNKRLEKAKALRIKLILFKAEQERLGKELATAETVDANVVSIAEATAIATAEVVKAVDKPTAEELFPAKALMPVEKTAEQPKAKPTRPKKTHKAKKFEDPVAHVVLRTEDEELSKVLQSLGLTTEYGNGFSIHTGDMGFVNALCQGDDVNVKLKADRTKQEED